MSFINFLLWICAAVAAVLMWMWGVTGFAMPEREPPKITHTQQDVGGGCVLHYYNDPIKHQFTKWVSCKNGETTTLNREGKAGEKPVDTRKAQP